MTIWKRRKIIKSFLENKSASNPCKTLFIQQFNREKFVREIFSENSSRSHVQIFAQIVDCIKVAQCKYLFHRIASFHYAALSGSFSTQFQIWRWRALSRSLMEYRKTREGEKSTANCCIINILLGTYIYIAKSRRLQSGGWLDSLQSNPLKFC